MFKKRPDFVVTIAAAPTKTAERFTDIPLTGDLTLIVSAKGSRMFRGYPPPGFTEVPTGKSFKLITRKAGKADPTELMEVLLRWVREQALSGYLPPGVVLTEGAQIKIWQGRMEVKTPKKESRT